MKTRIYCTKGFSLIELIVVIALIGIILAIATPELSRFVKKSQTIGQAEEFANDIRYAKAEAQKQNKPLYLNFKSSGASWCYGISVFSTATGATNDCDCFKKTSDSAACTQKMSNNSNTNNNASKNVSLDRSAFSKIRIDPLKGYPAPFSGTGLLTTDQEAIFTSTDGQTSLKVVLNPAGMTRICSITGASGYPSC